MRALLFPGQGSQKVGMGQALAERYPIARQTFQEADDALGFSISELCFSGPESELLPTARQQPAILTTSIAAMRVAVSERGLSASVAIGHSLGEYSALVSAGVLGFADAVRLVHARGRFMQEAVPAGEGGMAALLGLDPAEAEQTCRDACDQVGGHCAPANLNGAGQVVIAGHKGTVEAACVLARSRGAKRAVPLPVSAPFHCVLMEPAAARLREALAPIALQPFRFPVVANVDAEPNIDVGRVKDLLVRQVTSPVRFEEGVRCLRAGGVNEAVELGAGKVLSGLVKRISADIRVRNVETPQDVESWQ